MNNDSAVLSVPRSTSGFIPDAPSLQAVASLIKDLRKERNGDIIYLLDRTHLVPHPKILFELIQY